MIHRNRWAIAFVVLMVASGCGKSEPPKPPPADTVRPAPPTGRVVDSARIKAIAESRLAAQRRRDSVRQSFRDRSAIASQLATVRISSPTPGAILYVNGGEEYQLTSTGVAVRVPAGSVRLVIQAPRCAAWDTVFEISAQAQAAIGPRAARC